MVIRCLFIVTLRGAMDRNATSPADPVLSTPPPTYPLLVPTGIGKENGGGGQGEGLVSILYVFKMSQSVGEVLQLFISVC